MSAERIHHLPVPMIVIYGLQPSVVDKGQTVRWPAPNMPPSISNTADIVASKLSHLHGKKKKQKKTPEKNEPPPLSVCQAQS